MLEEKAPIGDDGLRAWLPYVAPFFGYVAMSSAESLIPDERMASWYPIAYAAKVAIVAALMVAFRSSWRDLRRMPGPLGWALAVGIGLAVTAAWVGIEEGVDYPPLPLIGAGEREGFDPGVLPTMGKWAFIAVRLLGLVVLVPVFEELFWRSFLIRLIIDADDFRKVPIGTVTQLSAFVTALGFMLVHPEWLPALLTGLAWAWLLHLTKSVAACVASHAAANLALGLYVLATGSWQYW